jgi:hypothetical protein
MRVRRKIIEERTDAETTAHSQSSNTSRNHKHTKKQHSRRIASLVKIERRHKERKREIKKLGQGIRRLPV